MNKNAELAIEAVRRAQETVEAFETLSMDKFDYTEVAQVENARADAGEHLENMKRFLRNTL